MNHTDIKQQTVTEIASRGKKRPDTNIRRRRSDTQQLDATHVIPFPAEPGPRQQ